VDSSLCESVVIAFVAISDGGMKGGDWSVCGRWVCLGLIARCIFRDQELGYYLPILLDSVREVLVVNVLLEVVGYDKYSVGIHPVLNLVRLLNVTRHRSLLPKTTKEYALAMIFLVI